MTDIDKQLLFLVFGGTVGGIFLGSEAVKHLFVEGLTKQERKGLLAFSAVGIGAYAIGNLLELDEEWKKWLMLDTAAEAAFKEFQAASQR